MPLVSLFVLIGILILYAFGFFWPRASLGALLLTVAAVWGTLGILIYIL